MARKVSIKKWSAGFTQSVDEVALFVITEGKGASAKHLSMLLDCAIIRLYRHFEHLVLNCLVGAINNDVSGTIRERTGIAFPAHLPDEVCEYLIVGNGYFDFKGRDGLIKTLRRYLPDAHYALQVFSDPRFRTVIEQLVALRNLAAHDSRVSLNAAKKALNAQRIGSAGAWLKSGSRFETLINSLRALSVEIHVRAPY